MLDIPEVSEFDTLGVKVGKALKAIVKGDLKRELSVLEERVLRESQRLLDGRQIYAWICAKFARDAKLARPQILQEIGQCRLSIGKGALAAWLNRWDGAVERLVQAGAQEQDQQILYIHFVPGARRTGGEGT